MSRSFIVGHTERGTQVLGYTGTHNGDHMVGSDLRNYYSIVRSEPFDENKPEHSRFISYRDFALARLNGRWTEEEVEAKIKSMVRMRIVPKSGTAA